MIRQFLNVLGEMADAGDKLSTDGFTVRVQSQTGNGFYYDFAGRFTEVKLESFWRHYVVFKVEQEMKAKECST